MMNRGSQRYFEEWGSFTSRAIATNVCLMLYPQPILAPRVAKDPTALRRIWAALNAIDHDTLPGNGRAHGGETRKP
jgi:adenine-specific DNA-methyltransferase